MANFISRITSWASTTSDDDVHHDMRHHAITSGSYGPARLYYQNDVPILEIQSDNPYEAGKAHGYLLSLSIHRLLLQQSLFPARPISEVSHGISRTIEELKLHIPFPYLEEMQGIADGFNTRVKENVITLEQLIYLHLIPDFKHFRAQELETSGYEDESVACTAVAARDKEKGITLGRTLDWWWFGGKSVGELSCVINRRYADKPSTVEIGFPGLVGTFTGMNDSGLSLCMNSCIGQTREIQGMPALFFNRHCLETARCVDDVAKVLTTTRPLGCYHLTVADNESALSLHLFQGTKKEHIVRVLSEGEPLITTNFRYTSQTRTQSGFEQSGERTRAVAEVFRKNPKKSISQLVADSLSVEPVDNDMTIHKVFMCPASRQLSLAFDKQNAGRAPLHGVDTTSLFTRPIVARAPSEAAPTAAPAADSRKREASPLEEDIPKQVEELGFSRCRTGQV